MLAELPPGYRKSDRMATSYWGTRGQTTGTKGAIRTIHPSLSVVKNTETLGGLDAGTAPARRGRSAGPIGRRPRAAGPRRRAGPGSVGGGRAGPGHRAAGPP